MDIFQSEEDDERKGRKSRSRDKTILQMNDQKITDKEDNKDEKDETEAQASLDADYSVDEFNLDEQLVMINESDEQSSEQVVQKKNR